MNYEEVTVVWIDQDANETADCLHTQACLRAVVDDVRVFDIAEKCIEYIHWIIPEKNIFLIVSGSLAELVLSKTHDIQQLKAVYILCLDKAKYAPLIDQYEKVCGIFIDKVELSQEIAKDVLSLDERSLTMNIFARKHENGIETSMRDYVADDKITLNWVECFCSMLIYLPLDQKQAKKDMIAQCRFYYVNNEAEQRRIDEFAQNINAENTIRWYTRDSFVYRLVNKALRTLNMDIIFEFRFFIIELYRQLIVHHTKYIKALSQRATSTVKISNVYRGQFINCDEVVKLKNNIGKKISTNSFWSTTEDKDIAEVFIADAPSSSSALFEIHIPDSYYEQVDDFLPYTRPFFKVSSMSIIDDEDEIIFSIGTIFRLLSVEEGPICRIKLELDEYNDSLTRRFGHFEKLSQYQHDWQTRSSVDDRILLLTEKLPASYRHIVNFYVEEGMPIDTKQYRKTVIESISYYRKGFDLLCKCLPDHSYLLRVIMCLTMGLWYNNLGDTAMSIRLGEYSLSIVRDYLDADGECLLVCYNFLAVIYRLDDRDEGAFAIYNDMFHIARQHKNISALLEICDKLCSLSREFGLNENTLNYEKKMLVCLLRILSKKIVSLPDHNHSFYFNYKILIKHLARLIKCKWHQQRKHSLEVLLAKKWPSFYSFTKYIDKLKYIFYFALDNPSALQQSLCFLHAQAIEEFEQRRIYEDCFRSLQNNSKQVLKSVRTCSTKTGINVNVLQNLLRSFNEYERALHSMRVTYDLIEVEDRYENNVLQTIFVKINRLIPNLIRSIRREQNNSEQRRILRHRQRSSSVVLSAYGRSTTSIYWTKALI